MNSDEHAWSDDARASGGSSSGAVGLVLLIAFSIFRMPPWLPLFAVESNGVDPSWQMLLNEAVSQDWVFGRDLFFTYGPFGFIHARMYHPETWSILIVTWLVIAAIMADLVWRVTAQGVPGSAGRMLCGIALIEFMSRDVMAICFGLHGLIYLEAICRVKPGSRALKQVATTTGSPARLLRISLPVLLLATLPWAKFSYFVTASWLGCALMAVAFLQQRMPWRSILLLLACPLTWVMNGGTLTECREFVAAGFQLAGGYSAAMGLGPTTQAGLVMIVSAGCVVLLLPVWLAFRIQSDDRRLRLLTMLFFHGLLFITWKSCFVRYHAERIPAFTGTVLPLITYGWFAFASRGSNAAITCRLSELAAIVQRRIISPALVVILLFVLAAGGIERVQPLTVSAAVDHAVTPVRDQLLATVESVKDPNWRHNTHQSQLVKIREANPIPKIDGSIDVFPSKLIVAFGHGLSLKPRPVLQSYAAFTPELIRRDGRHIRGANSSDYVLMSVNGIDERLPTMEDSQAWLELLSNYKLTDPDQSRSAMVLLGRRADRSLEVVAEPDFRSTVTWGETIHLPPNLAGPVWCRIWIKPSVSGKLASLLYRLPEIRLRTQAEGNEHSQRDFRLLIGAAQAGFLISPLVETREDVIGLWRSTGETGEFAESDQMREVTSIACYVAGNDWCRQLFQPEILVQFFRVDSRSGGRFSPKALQGIAVASP